MPLHLCSWALAPSCSCILRPLCSCTLVLTFPYTLVLSWPCTLMPLCSCNLALSMPFCPSTACTPMSHLVKLSLLNILHRISNRIWNFLPLLPIGIGKAHYQLWNHWWENLCVSKCIPIQRPIILSISSEIIQSILLQWYKIITWIFKRHLNVHFVTCLFLIPLDVWIIRNKVCIPNPSTWTIKLNKS